MNGSSGWKMKHKKEKGFKMGKFLKFAVLAVVLLSACTTAANHQQGSSEDASRLVTVYRSPT